MGPGPVLIVDDDAVSRHVLSQALRTSGLAYEAVGSGSEALVEIERLKPSLLVLDLLMPAPDGYEILRILRARPETKDLAVLVLTAVDDENEIARAFEAGADDFLRKPFRPTELVARIRGQLRLRRVMDQLERKEKDAQVVLELTQALASNLDFRGILFTVVQRIAEVAKVDRVSIVLVRDPGDVGYVVAASDDEHLRDLAIDLTQYPEIREVLREGEPLVIPDAATHPLLETTHLKQSQTPTFSSLAILPILYEGRPMGVLFLRARQAFAFGDHELGLCKTVSNAMAIALRNARVLQSLRDQTQQVTVARFEAERRLRALQRYADFFESSADGIVVIDGEGRLLFSNPKARELTGYGEQDLRGTKLGDLFAEEDAVRGRELRDGFAEGRYPRDLDIRVARKDGRIIVLSINFNSVLREEGVVLCTFRDVTEARAVEGELARAQAKLLEQERQAIIAELAGAAAHELNQPLTSVMVSAELLKRRIAKDSPAFSSAEIIIHQAERMADIVRKIGRITKYETKSYVGQARILDIDKASDAAAPSAGGEHGRDAARAPESARPEGSPRDAMERRE